MNIPFSPIIINRARETSEKFFNLIIGCLLFVYTVHCKPKHQAPRILSASENAQVLVLNECKTIKTDENEMDEWNQVKWKPSDTNRFVSIVLKATAQKQAFEIWKFVCYRVIWSLILKLVILLNVVNILHKINDVVRVMG